MAKRGKIYRDPRKPDPGQPGRYDGMSPTYRRNQIGDYGSNNDRYEKAINLVPSLIDQKNPYLFPGRDSNDGYWKVYIIKISCRDDCGVCPDESGKILVYNGEKPLNIYFGLAPSINISVGSDYLQLHRWSEVPTTVDDVQTKRFWFADLPFNAVAEVPAGVYSVSCRNPLAVNPNYASGWDACCLAFGQLALGNLTVEMVSF